MGKQKKAAIKVKAQPKKKPIKPKMGKGTGGAITAKLVATVERKK